MSPLEMPDYAADARREMAESAAKAMELVEAPQRAVETAKSDVDAALSNLESANLQYSRLTSERNDVGQRLHELYVAKFTDPNVSVGQKEIDELSSSVDRMNRELDVLFHNMVDLELAYVNALRVYYESLPSTQKGVEKALIELKIKNAIKKRDKIYRAISESYSLNVSGNLSGLRGKLEIARDSVNKELLLLNTQLYVLDGETDVKKHPSVVRGNKAPSRFGRVQFRKWLQEEKGVDLNGIDLGALY